MAKGKLNGYLKLIGIIITVAVLVGTVIWNTAILHNDVSHITADISQIKDSIKEEFADIKEEIMENRKEIKENRRLIAGK